MSIELEYAHTYFVEKKYDGFRAILHKSGNQIRILSDQKKDITSAFPTIANEAKKLTKFNLIIDGELVPYKDGKPMGRRPLAKFIGAIKSGKKLSDKNIKFHVFDALYFGDKSLQNLRLYERKKVLNTINWTERILKVKHFMARSPSELRNVVKTVSMLPGSEGAMIKQFNSTYPDTGRTSDWFKFKKHSYINAIIIEVHNPTPTAYNYTVGIPIPEKIDKAVINPKRIIDYKGKRMLRLGNTFNTGLKAAVGDTLQIGVEEIWRHVKTETNVWHWSMHKPMVMKKTNKDISTWEDLDSIAMAKGFAVSYTEELDEFELDEEGGEVMYRNFPKRMQKNFRAVMETQKWFPFAVQWHLRGKSVHSDIRHLIPEGYLEGYTLFDPGNIEKPSKLEKGQHHIRGTLKLIQPKSWLTYDGISKIAGATKQFPGVFIIVGKGKYRIKEVTDHKITFEYKSVSGQVNKSPMNEASKEDLPVRELPNNLIEFNGLYSLHIAHIRPKEWIILWDKLKS